jgi:tetratricopeptide (TPR) repeat protein
LPVFGLVFLVGFLIGFLMKKRVLLTIMLMLAWSTCAPAQAKSGLRRLPQARTQQEYNDYGAAHAAVGGAALEAAADDFSARHPESELRVYLYSHALHVYQREGNAARILAAGEKVLALDPDNSIALALTATALADSISDNDPGREQKVAQVKQDCAHALKTMDSSLVLVPGVTPEEITAYKGSLGSMVHSALGIMELKTGNNSGAEKDLKTALNLNRLGGDASLYYHLALAQDHQKKYSDALASVEQALQLASSNPDLQQLAEKEHEHLQQVAGRREQQNPR